MDLAARPHITAAAALASAAAPAPDPMTQYPSARHGAHNYPR
ncbi:hypothetical protein [Mycobacterium malmoense]|nr:hypothetical protein [Mycobacterium malmoense]